MDTEEAFGRVLRRRRRLAALSQEKLALDADVERNYISLLELGRYSPSLKVIFKLAAVLGVRPSAMIEEVEDVARGHSQKEGGPTS